MKNFILSILFFYFLSYTAQGQLIVKGAVTSSKVNFKESDEYKFSSIPGGLLGVGYITPVDSSNFSILLELLFIQKGVKENSEINGVVSRTLGETTIKMNYVEVPLLLKYTIGKKRFQFFLNSGFSFSVGVGGKFNTQITETPRSNAPHYIDGKVGFGKKSSMSPNVLGVDNKIDIGFQFGGGFVFGKRIILDFRYGLGLSNLYDENPNAADNDHRSKNRVAQFSLGYLFGRAN